MKAPSHVHVLADKDEELQDHANSCRPLFRLCRDLIPDLSEVACSTIFFHTSASLRGYGLIVRRTPVLWKEKPHGGWERDL